MINNRLSNLLLSLLGLTAIISRHCVKAQYDENGIFIDCGGEGFIDQDGNEWIGDDYLAGYIPVGSRYVLRGSKADTPISGTKNDSLYRSERWYSGFGNDASMEIKVPVAPGLYDVRLHFAEIFFEQVDTRVFDVYVQNDEVYKALDIYSLVGKNTALTITSAARVFEDEETIDIRLDRVDQNQKISGIEIRPILEVEEFEPVYINCGGGAFRDSQGRRWSEDQYFDPQWSRPFSLSSTSQRTIKNTDPQDYELYRTERYSTRALQYDIPVPRGTYKVSLYFAEVYYSGAGSVGKRVFDVLIEGSSSDKIDIYKEVGANALLKVDAPGFVSDGSLTITLEPPKRADGSYQSGQYPKLSAIEVQEINEVYQWNNFGRNGLTLVIMDALTNKWSDIFQGAVSSWNRGRRDSDNESSGSLNLLTIEIPPDSACLPIPGRIKVCNGDYGQTSWVGLNTVTLQDGFIKNSVARMNDYYLSRSTLEQQKYAMCHEMGKFTPRLKACCMQINALTLCGVPFLS